MPWYKRFEFWSAILGAVVELVIGFGWPEKAALLASVGALVLGAVVAGGLVTRESVRAKSEERLAHFGRNGVWPKE